MKWIGTTSAMWLRSDRKQQLAESCHGWLQMDPDSQTFCVCVCVCHWGTGCMTLLRAGCRQAT